MTHTHRTGIVCLAIGVMAGTVYLGAQANRQAGPPQRDTPAQQAAAEAKPVKGRIAGRVSAADTGRPVRRARVFLSGSQVQGGRGVLTNDEGAFELTELPEGRYTLTAGKTGFITLAYGQRRPLQAGIPIQLADGQQLTGLDFRLPRGSVIAGHVFDETGDPLPGANVRVMLAAAASAASSDWITSNVPCTSPSFQFSMRTPVGSSPSLLPQSSADVAGSPWHSMHSRVSRMGRK